MVSKILKFGNQKGSSLSLPAHGRAGARATSSLAAHFAKRNTKFGGGGKARAGKNSFPPTPFLFARPSDWILKFGIRIFVKKCSNINQKTPQAKIIKIKETIKANRSPFVILKLPMLNNCCAFNDISSIFAG